MKKRFTILSILIFVFGLTIGVNIVIAQTDQLPKILSISPSPVYDGDEITILGENFENCTPGVTTNSKILIDGVETPFWTGDSEWGNEQIVYTTKLGQNSGKLKIKTCSNLLSNEVDLIVIQRKPVIISVAPNKIYPGTFVVVNGTDFGNTDPGSSYQFYLNGQHIDRGNISSWTNNSFKMYIENKTIPGDYQLQIEYSLNYYTTNKGFSNKIKFTVLDSCAQDKWECGEWDECSSSGKKQRTCTKTFDCPSTETTPPATTQSCTYAPPCSADTWQCGNWSTCSPQGIQTRSCSRTYDCPSVETATPATSQYCEAPQQNYQTPSTNSDIVANQDSIIKATVKLVCPISGTLASQGSGTVINSTGLILTNKHVIDGTAGCWVGFIDDYDDEPYFGDRQIADIYKISSDADVAVLKLRNPGNKMLTSINISQGNGGNIKLGEILTTYGYPAKFGTKITYTSGDFSGVDGNYLKTTAIIEHGNSGGGAYFKNGTFIGIPTAVVKGSLNSMGYLLSVNKINSWLNNSIAYNYNSNNNNYSRVSAILDDMDLNSIGSLGLFIAGDEKNIKTETESRKVIKEEKSLITKIDNNLSKRVSGNILLQVEKNGEGWYVNPDDKKKYYLGRPADAFSIMRNLGLGIKHSELAQYLNSKFPSRLSGKILLDVEQNGEAYYINPKDLKGYFLNRPSDAFLIMRKLGLGITNNDIRKIDVGEVK